MFTINFKDFIAASLLFLLLVLTQIVQAEEIVTNRVMPDSAGQGMVPPPPPGPYVSSGLRDTSSKASPAARPSSVSNVATRSAARIDSTDIPMEAYSPYRPWPTNLRPTAGGDTRNPNLPYMNNQRTQRMPYMGAGSQGPNAYMPNFSSPGYGYQMPNGFVPQNNYPYGYPMNRMPYPPNYQQGYPN